MAVFDTHVADSRYERSLLTQGIMGGGITVDDRLFTVLEDSKSFVSRYFPARIACYECFVAFVGGIQNVKKGVVSRKEFQDQELHESRVARTNRQSNMVASFATTFPELFGSEAFSKLGTHADFNNGDGSIGMRFTLLNGFKDERGALRAHIKVVLEAHPDAMKLANTILAETYSWVVWFVDAFESYYHSLVAKATGSATSTASAPDPVKKSCWKRALDSLRTLFEELKDVRVKAASAHLCATVLEQNALFLHCTFQELRIMRAFREDDWYDYPAVRSGLVQHLYDTYQPRTGVDLTSRVSSMENRQGQLRSDLNNLRSARAGRGGPGP